MKDLHKHPFTRWSHASPRRIVKEILAAMYIDSENSAPIRINYIKFSSLQLSKKVHFHKNRASFFKQKTANAMNLDPDFICWDLLLTLAFKLNNNFLKKDFTKFGKNTKKTTNQRK